jgi:hypothetical protein
MRADVRRDYEFGRLFIPQAQAIVGQYLAVEEAPFEEDAERNTDLIVLAAKAGQIRVGLRVRDRYYLNRRDEHGGLYRDQFTIRSSRPNGTATELGKILNGWGDYFLYGFGERGGLFRIPRLVTWTLADLSVFRACHRSNLGMRVRNPDRTEGRAFEWGWFPPEFVIHTSRTEQQQVTP